MNTSTHPVTWMLDSQHTCYNNIEISDIFLELNMKGDRKRWITRFKKGHKLNEGRTYDRDATEVKLNVQFVRPTKHEEQLMPDKLPIPDAGTGPSDRTLDLPEYRLLRSAKSDCSDVTRGNIQR